MESFARDEEIVFSDPYAAELMTSAPEKQKQPVSSSCPGKPSNPVVDYALIDGRT